MSPKAYETDMPREAHAANDPAYHCVRSVEQSVFRASSRVAATKVAEPLPLVGEVTGGDVEGEKE